MKLITHKSIVLVILYCNINVILHWDEWSVTFTKQQYLGPCVQAPVRSQLVKLIFKKKRFILKRHKLQLQ